MRQTMQYAGCFFAGKCSKKSYDIYLLWIMKSKSGKDIIFTKDILKLNGIREKKGETQWNMDFYRSFHLWLQLEWHC